MPDLSQKLAAAEARAESAESAIAEWKALAERWEDDRLKAQREETRLREALEQIAKSSYGLQGLIEEDASPERIADYWALETHYRRDVARRALAQKEENHV